MKLILFDVDGTLTPARKQIEPEMLTTLEQLTLNDNIHVGFVGGSNLEKQIEQLRESNFHLFHWRFSENGLLAFKEGECIHKESFVNVLTDVHFKQFINICLRILSELECPVKRGTFIEFREGMLNISPIGRACNQVEREQFELYDNEHKVRETMITQIQELWSNYVNVKNLQYLPKLQFSVGGQISVDVFPKGWDKTYCLKFVEEKYDEIHFFGDKTDKGGNDYEIYCDDRVIGHKVMKYQDTIDILQNMFINKSN